MLAVFTLFLWLQQQKVPSARRRHKVDNLPGWSIVGNDAYHALELLELGRGIIAGLLLEMRTDISSLEQQHVELAERFSSLRDELDSPTDREVSLFSGESRLCRESRTKRRREAEDSHEVIKDNVPNSRTSPSKGLDWSNLKLSKPSTVRPKY